MRQYSCPVLNWLWKLERPEILGKYLITVKAKTLNWRNMLYFGGMSILPEHYLKDLDGTAYLEEYNMKMLPGSGPYIIKDEDVINQESFTLTRLENWWAKDRELQKIYSILIKSQFQLLKIMKH